MRERVMCQHFGASGTGAPGAYLDMTSVDWNDGRPALSVAHCLIINAKRNESLETLLRGAGFHTETTEPGESVMTKVELLEPDFVILDLGMAHSAEVATCRVIRKRSDIPIIVLNDTTNAEIENALVAGADAYLIKPLRKHELIARVRALLRRRPAMNRLEQPDRVGEILVNRTTGMATVAGKRLELSVREFQLLSVLVADCGRRVTRRETLLEAAEGPHALDAAIRRVRALLEVEEGWRRLVSVRGIGFRLIRRANDR
ncbi:MAG: hypothetical protein NVS3B21_15640 [Acidimicrobiales bacterium]